MNFRKNTRLLLFAALILTLSVSTGYGYTVDGMLNDWNVDLGAPGADQLHYLDTHLPPAPVYSISEDNASSAQEWTKVDPLWSYKNWFDVEAMYLTNDATNLYLAIVTGFPIGGYDRSPTIFYDTYQFMPGDIFISTDDDASYEYGIDFHYSGYDPGTHTALLKEVVSTQDVFYSAASAANPWRILNGSNPRSVPFVYSENINDHYVLEASVPLAYIGLQPGDPLSVHWTMECGNDELDLDARIIHTPAPAGALLLASGLVSMIAARRRPAKKG